MRIQIVEDLGRALQGDKMVNIEIDRLRLQLRTVLDGLGALSRKRAHVDRAAWWAGFNFISCTYELNSPTLVTQALHQYHRHTESIDDTVPSHIRSLKNFPAGRATSNR